MRGTCGNRIRGDTRPLPAGLYTTSTPAGAEVFLQGQARLTLGDHATTAGPGAWVHMQPHLPHSIYAETTVVMLLTMV